MGQRLARGAARQQTLQPGTQAVEPRVDPPPLPKQSAKKDAYHDEQDILRRQSKLQPYDHRHQAEPGHDGFAHPFRQPVPQERPEPAAREDGAHVDQSARGYQWFFPVFTS